MSLHSIVIPVFNEASGIPELHLRVSQVINTLLETRGDRCEIILVDDGSMDGSAEALDHLHERDPRFKVLHLTRNFGRPAALTAGIHWARGDTVTLLDADLQDPPELIPKLLQKWEQGYEVVYGIRQLRPHETWLQLWIARKLYRLSRSIQDVDLPLDAGEFRLMDRKAVKAFLDSRTRAGLRQTGILYERGPRKQDRAPSPLPRRLKHLIRPRALFRVKSSLGFEEPRLSDSARRIASQQA